MKYFLLAGEASGDLHGSHLMQSLTAQDSDADFRHWGGDMMKGAGGDQLKHISDLAFMGFWEVAMNITTINRFFKECKQAIQKFKPDAIILIDYPGFNLRMASWAKDHGYRVYYYISPQLWAWKGKRIEKIKKYVDRLFVILPFEKTYYADRGVDVSYYGHPLLDLINNYRQENQVENRTFHSLFPGSRKQEISQLLPIMMAGARLTDVEEFHISKAPSIPDTFYNNLIGTDSRFKLFNGTSYDLFNQSQSALVTSGTATLECALFDVPQIVCYTGSKISYAIAKRLIHIKYIALANLIMDKEIVKELIQAECNPENIATHFNDLQNPEFLTNILNGYAELKNKLTTDEELSVPDLIANEIIQRLN